MYLFFYYFAPTFTILFNKKLHFIYDSLINVSFNKCLFFYYFAPTFTILFNKKLHFIYDSLINVSFNKCLFFYYFAPTFTTLFIKKTTFYLRLFLINLSFINVSLLLLLFNKFVL